MKIDFDRTPWKLVHPDLALYRYQGEPDRQPLSQSPVLMLHGPMTSHRTWDTIAYYLWQNGLHDLYAVDIADIQMGGSLRTATSFLEQVVPWVLEQYESPLIMLGHSTGGVLARRFLFKSPQAERIAFLFTLASPHSLTHFSYQVYVPEENPLTETRSGDSNFLISLVKTPKIPHNTFIVNIFGDAVGPNFDGTVHGVYLPEGMNVVMRLGHAELKHHTDVVDEILACLRGERYRMQFFLEMLLMRVADQDNMVGPFYFEVNGMRSPFTGTFQAEVDHYYNFEDNSTPLATLAYPTTQTLASTVFRLKDLSRNRPVRRRLLAKLLDSLSNKSDTLHEMQDNEGSKIALRVITQRMPALLAYPPSS